MSSEDETIEWDDVDADAIRRMIAESDAEGGEIPLEEIMRQPVVKAVTGKR